MSEISSLDTPSATILSKLGREDALRMLDELTGMTRAGIPWHLGLHHLSRSKSHRIAVEAARFRDGLAAGVRGDELVSGLTASLGQPLQALFSVAQHARQPGDVLQGLVHVVATGQRRQQEMRQLLTYPILMTLFSVAIIAVSASLYHHPQGLALPIQAIHEEAKPLAPTTGWYWPMAIGFKLSLAAVVCFYFVTRLRPDHWSRLAWFTELLALQVESQQPLADSVERAAEVALVGKHMSLLKGWAKQWRVGGGTIKANPLPLLYWTLKQPQDPRSLASRLRELTRLYRDRAESLSSVWQRVLPNLLIFGCIGGMVGSYFLGFVLPVYRLF